MNISFRGFESTRNSIKSLPSKIGEGLKVGLAEVGELLNKVTRTEHEWNNQTSNLQQDIDYTIKGLELEQGLGFNPRATTSTGFHYGVWLHNGTQPYTIKPKEKKALYWGNGFYGKVNHPGLKSDPWIFEAFSKNEPKIAPILQENVNKEISK